MQPGVFLLLMLTRRLWSGILGLLLGLRLGRGCGGLRSGIRGTMVKAFI